MKLYRTKDRGSEYLLTNDTHGYFITSLNDLAIGINALETEDAWFIRFATNEDMDTLIIEFSSLEDLQSNHLELFI